MICLLILVGCTPKRVIHHEIFSEENNRAQKKPAKGPQPRTTVKSGEFGGRAVALAKKQLGKMYQWGGEGPDRFDCSGLVYYVYGNLGISMPRVSAQQAKVGKEIGRKNILPGDMLYFATSGQKINHVGIYLGQAKFIHAPRKGMPVRKDSLNDGWWKQKYRGARRIKGP